jgi:hypothetical protein
MNAPSLGWRTGTAVRGMRIPKGPLKDSVSTGYTMTDHDDRGRTAEFKSLLQVVRIVHDKAAFADSIDAMCGPAAFLFKHRLFRKR